MAGQVIFHDDRAVITEMAFGPYALITPHANQSNTALFIVISGGGFVQVGDERARVNHGEAVLWPPGVLHGAYTDGTEMRVIIVELVGDEEQSLVAGVATAQEAGTDQPAQPTPASGTLAERTRTRDEYDASEGEPW